MATDTDILIIGGGLAGLVAACECAEAGKKVIIVEQEGEQSLGGQAFWSFGGLFLVDTPEQRRVGIRDSRDLAWTDWQGTARFEGEQDFWPRQWAEAYVNFAAGSMAAACAGSPSSDGRSAVGIRLLPMATPCRAFTSPGARGRAF